MPILLYVEETNTIFFFHFILRTYFKYNILVSFYKTSFIHALSARENKSKKKKIGATKKKERKKSLKKVKKKKKTKKIKSQTRNDIK